MVGIEDVKLRLLAIEHCADDLDAAEDMAHDLWRDIFQDIAAGRCAEPKELASLALESCEILTRLSMQAADREREAVIRCEHLQETGEDEPDTDTQVN